MAYKGPMATPALRCRLLRAPLLSCEDTEIELHSDLQQRLLARLACASGALVSRAELVDVLWPRDPPRTAVELLSSHVARLRTAVAPYVDRPDALIPRSEGGYRLDPTLIRTDVTELATAAVALRDDRSTAALADARRSLAVFDRSTQEPSPDQLWWIEAVDRAWDDLRRVLAALLDADSHASVPAGRWDDLLPFIALLADHRPFDEPVLAWRIEALVRTRRVAESLLLTDAVRRRLVDELGADPGPELDEAFRLALSSSAGRAADECPDAIRSPPSRSAAAGTVLSGVPRQLPAPPAVFAGRDREVESLVASLRPTASAGPALIMVTGPAGVGKSALAQVAASRVRDHFPDGQVYFDLGGDGGHDPAAALRSVLTELGVPIDAERVVDLAGLVRSTTADRRMLWVLDNVTAQHPLAPLLPTSSESVVLLTGCTMHPDVVAAEQHDLSPLGPDPAAQLLVRVVGEARLRAEPAATADLLDTCEGLPSAVLQSGRQMRTHAHRSVADLVHRLDDTGRRLATFSAGTHGLSDALDEVVASLDGTAVSALAALGLVEEQRCEPPMLAALLAITIAEAEQLLEDLHEARLVEFDGRAECGTAVYVYGPLLHRYARDRWDSSHTEEETVAALERRARAVDPQPLRIVGAAEDRSVS